MSKRKSRKKIVFSNIDSSSSSDEDDSKEIELTITPEIPHRSRHSKSSGLSFDRSITSDNSESKNSNQKKSKKNNSNQIFEELIINQIDHVPIEWKLNISDMKRICKYVENSIFDENLCCIWKGYVTNLNNTNKGTYVNFYFKNKKVALHRLLYSNYVEPLDASDYLKFKCANKGICCNINHYEKYKYSKNTNIINKNNNKKPKREIKNITIISSDDPDALVIDFE